MPLYQTIVFERIRQVDALHARLKAERQLQTAVEATAAYLKMLHQATIARFQASTDSHDPMLENLAFEIAWAEVEAMIERGLLPSTADPGSEPHADSST